ncbi:MAG: 23S rRNA (guanosine2251-2'-O)-methyltransferase [Kiritimatiellia bacterium]|jgi:23S rRNA (guanosine2251-2'-O)-methyltransferase
MRIVYPYMQTKSSEHDIIYGVNPVFEVLRAGRRQLFRAMMNEKVQDQPRMRKLLDLMEERKVRVAFRPKDQLNQQCNSTEHQGVILEAASYPYSPIEPCWEQNRLLLLDNIEDPQNLGAIIRSAEILGFHYILIPQRGVPGIYPSVVKAAAGATEHVHIVQSGSAVRYAQRAAENGYQVVALDAGGKDLLAELPARLGEKFLLVIGGEDKSVGQYILNNADFVAGIPQTGRVNSLNASVAAGIAMYALGTRDE